MTRVQNPEMSPSISGNMYMTEVALQISGTGTITTWEKANTLILISLHK